AAVTADASAEIALGGPVVLPTFSMHVAPPSNPAGYDAANSDFSAATPLFALTSRSAGIVITADAGTDFPAGTRFELSVNGTTFPEQASPSWTVSLADLGYTEATAPALASPASLSIMCPARNNRAQVPETGSGSASVCLLYTIPSFTITFAPPAAPSYVAAKSDAAAKKYAMADLDGDFSFTPVPAAGSFPTGTTFEWTVESGSLSCTPAATGIGTAATAALSGSPGLGLTDATIGRTTGTATAVTVKCTAKNTYAADKDAPDKSMSAFLLQTMPAFTIRIDPPASYNAGNSSVALNKYALTSLEDGFTITAIPNAPATGFPEDTTFSWSYGSSTVVDPVTGTAVTGTSCTITPAMLGVSSTSPGTKTSPKSKLLSCSASSPNTAEDQLAPNKTLQAFLLTIPNITVTLSTPPAGLTTNSSGAYSIKTADLTTKNFEFTASPVAGSTMPDGVKYAWTIGTTALNTASTSDQTITRTLDDLGITALPASQQTLTVKCTVSHDSLAAGTEKYNTVNVKIAPAAVKMKTGSGIKAVLHALGANSGSGKTFSASATAPTEGTSTQLLSDTGSEVEVLAWLDADGTSIKYYAADYTDSSRKIPLNADSGFMFNICKGLTSIDVSGFDTSNVTSMKAMFGSCSGLTSITGLSGFNTSKVESMESMFNGCTVLTSLD
ncbi:MAG: BspA family leucine-rich repeat surface protein, partial [Treponema sp.]|nr:BspA family leucine-rich repeat surface protein [Treponema sp.]